MSTDEKLAAILAAVQVDPGQRGLANIFPICAADFAAACRSVEEPGASLGIYTGFYIPTATPPAPETDGPLGAIFLLRALAPLGIDSALIAEPFCRSAFRAGLQEIRANPLGVIADFYFDHNGRLQFLDRQLFTHPVALERVGPASDGRCYTMRGIDVTERMLPLHHDFRHLTWSIGIGDGGNEIGMGKIPHEAIVANIPNGDLIHCRVPTENLIVAGVSNWGAYALAAGVYVLRGVKPASDVFDPDRERKILEVMVREGPLVDGVTGQRTATVDGLSWDDYVKPLIQIRDIVNG